MRQGGVLRYWLFQVEYKSLIVGVTSLNILLNIFSEQGWTAAEFVSYSLFLRAGE